MPAALAILAVWPFASIGMLWWAGAAALPIIIHLWNRRRFREMNWAAMEFLLAAMRKNSRRLLIEEWILLAVRALILLLLALALADPILSSLPGFMGVGGGQTYTILVVDGSYSMACRREGKSRFARAKEWASSLVERGLQGDGYSLYLMADAPQAVIGEPAFDRRDVVAELEALELPQGGGNLAALVGEVEKRCAAVERQHPRLAHVRVLFLTDLGRSTWESVGTTAVSEPLARLAEKATLAVVDVGDSQQENLALTRLSQRNVLAVAGAEQTFEVEVQSFGLLEPTRPLVRLLVDGRQVQEQAVELGGAGAATASFTYRVAAAGEHMVSAELADDALPVDNRRYLSLPVRSAVRVLCVEGRRGEARELALALNPRTEGEQPVRVEVAGDNALAEMDLASYDAIFLSNVARLAGPEAALLHDFVSHGGGLVIFLGDQVQPESYNRELGAAAGAKRLLPAEVGPVAGGEAEFHFDPLGYRHPLVREFDGTQRNGIILAPTWRYHKLKPSETGAPRTAVAFTGGDVAIVEETFGPGHVALVATAASLGSVDRNTSPPTPWTAISTYGSFVPLAQSLLRLTVHDRSAERNVLVGEPLVGARASPSDTVTVVGPVGPNQRSERVSVERAGGRSRWEFTGTGASGVWRAEAGDKPAELFSVNVNPSLGESDLARLLPEEMPEQLELASTGVETGSAGPVAPASQHYFRYLLGAVLGLLLVESCLAWRMGGGA